MTITASSLINMIGSINIIDIRNSCSYNNNHIPSSKNIEYKELLENPNKYLDKNVKYYIYCQKGIQSYKLCSYLNRLGYMAISVIGGYEEYILES